MRIWSPQPRQTLFLENPAYEAGYGGAKGGGKTDAILADAMQQVHLANYKAIIFRRTFPKLQEIIDRSMRLFTGYAKYSGDNHRWVFPSGATIQFSHCQNEADKYNYQGQEYHYIAFDQLEEFTESIYEFLIAQNRTSDPKIKCYVRATFNPGNIGHAWVKKRFVDKLKPDGQIKFFRKVNDEDTICRSNEPGAMSRAFIFAKVTDNEKLLEADPDYINRLKNLPEQQRKALLEGDWDAFEGQFFKEWQRSVHVIPYSSFVSMAADRPTTRFIASDYGFKAPQSTGWYAVFPDGEIIRYRELYCNGLTYEKLAEEVIKMSRGESIDYWAVDPAIQGDKSHHTEPKDGITKGKSGYDVLCEKVAGKFSVLLADNRRVVGWTRMHEYIKPYINQHGIKSAMLRVTDNCKEFIRTFPTLVFDERNPEDVNTDGEDHAGDEARYAIMSRQNIPADKPKPETPTTEFWKAVKSDLKNSENILTDDDSEGIPISEGSEI